MHKAEDSSPIGRLSGGAKTYRYYVCNRASKEGWDKCPAPSLPAAEVEKFVVEEIARIGEDAELRAEIVAQHEANRKEELARAATDKRKLERQVQQIGTAVREAIANGESAILADLQRQGPGTVCCHGGHFQVRSALTN